VAIWRMMEGVNSVMIYFIYCKNFCKSYNVLPAQQQQQERKKKEKEETHLEELFIQVVKEGLSVL
jgi:hypothetical protein